MVRGPMFPATGAMFAAGIRIDGANGEGEGCVVGIVRVIGVVVREEVGN